MDLGDVCLGFILGIAFVVGLMAYLFNQEEESPFRHTIGEMLMETGLTLTKKKRPSEKQ